jgi:hypothetical protein
MNTYVYIGVKLDETSRPLVARESRHIIRSNNHQYITPRYMYVGMHIYIYVCSMYVYTYVCVCVCV